MSRRRALLGGKKNAYPGYKELQYIYIDSSHVGYVTTTILLENNTNKKYTWDVQVISPGINNNYYALLQWYSAALTIKVTSNFSGIASNSYNGISHTTNERFTITYYRGSKGYITDGTTTLDCGTPTNSNRYLNIPICSATYIKSSTTLRVFNLVITDSNTPIYNFIPVERESDNVIGFLDTINMVFYPPTTGTFLAGPYM